MKPVGQERAEDDGATVMDLGRRIPKAELEVMIREYGVRTLIRAEPLVLSMIATRILAQDRKERHGIKHGAVDGWLSPWQIMERRSHEVYTMGMEQFDVIPNFRSGEDYNWDGWTGQKVKRQAQVCVVEGCNSESHSRSMCHKHYKRWQRHGDATVVKTPQRGEGVKT